MAQELLSHYQDAEGKAYTHTNTLQAPVTMTAIMCPALREDLCYICFCLLHLPVFVINVTL